MNITKNRPILAILFLLTQPTRVCSSATLVNTDFARNATGWVLNGYARLLTMDGQQILSLTQNEETQIGVAWTELKRSVPSFSFIADVRVRFHPRSPEDCPADGLTLGFAAAGSATMGAGGGALGLYHGIETFACFEINTWHDHGLGTDDERADCTSGKHVTFAFDWIHPDLEFVGRAVGQRGTPEKGGAKIGQVLPPPGMTIVNGGWYRYQWNVDGATNTMTVYVTGLEERNKQFQKVEVLKVKFARNPIDFEGRFGLTATTGGAVQHVDVARVRVEAPMIPPP